MREKNNFKTKKILFFSTLPPPIHGASLSSKMCLEILRADSSFEVKNIKLNHSVNFSDLGKISLKKIIGFISIGTQIAKTLKEFNPNIIYFVPAVKDGALIRDYLYIKFIRLLCKRKMILHLRGQFSETDWKNFWKRYLIKDLLKCHKVIVLGPELISNLHNTVAKENIYIMPNAIPQTLSDEEFESINNAKFNYEKKSLCLLFLSNMMKEKGWLKVLIACRILKESGAIFKCHFVGGWPSNLESDEFYTFVEENNLKDDIIYHGELFKEEKNKILSEADILVFPTSNEAFGRVIIESMEFGLPVISNCCGTIPSIISHYQTGFVLNNNSPDEIAEYVFQLYDTNFRKSMALKSRERFIERFTLPKYKTSFLNIFYEN